MSTLEALVLAGVIILTVVCAALIGANGSRRKH
jgi:hypothetical protein